MLTANNYDNTVPYLDFVKSSFLGHSLPKTLKEYSFSVDFDPMLKYTVYTDFSGVAPTGRKLEDWGLFFREQALIADLALFRNVPHFMKESIYNHQRWFISDLLERRRDAGSSGGAPRGGGQGSSEPSALKYARELENLKVFNDRNRDPRFIERMLQSSGTMERTDAFKFYHLKGIHLPLIMNENLDYEEMQPFRANMLRQGTGMLKIAATLLERLKQLKVYDNSLIFIVGDHGSGVGDAKINVTPYGDRFNTRGPYKGNFQRFKAIGIPLILVKRMHATGELKTSDAPVSLGDIPQTVVDELGLDAGFPGKSMFRVEENEDRERIYRAFVGPQEDVEYLAPLLRVRRPRIQLGRHELAGNREHLLPAEMSGPTARAWSDALEMVQHPVGAGDLLLPDDPERAGQGVLEAALPNTRRRCPRATRGGAAPGSRACR